MTTLLWVLLSVVITALFVIIFFGFKLLQNSFEGMQRNLLLSQKELEKSYELKASGLRNEIQQLNQNVGNKLEQNLKEGFVHYQKIQEHLKQAEQQLLHLNSVGKSINDLNNLLKLPHLRGQFGEAIMEQILNDFLPQDSYELQYQIIPNSSERVDAVIKYPNAVLPIDSKFPREQVLPLFETNDPLLLEKARDTLFTAIRVIAKSIKEKYIHPEHGTTEMALLFVPSETLYFEILKNIKICEELSKFRVFAVSPNTFSVTLQSLSLARSYYEMAKGVEKTIIDIKKSQQHFKNFETRFEDIGKSLNKAQSSYNMATTHLSRYSSSVTRLTGVEENEELTSLPESQIDKISEVTQ